MLRREHLSLPYADQVPLLARLLEQGDPVVPAEPRRLVAAAFHHNVAGYLARALGTGQLTLPADDAARVTEFVGESVLQTAVLRRVLGARAGAVPVNSIKGALGHTMGAAATLEAIMCLLASRDGVVPGTAGYEEAERRTGNSPR